MSALEGELGNLQETIEECLEQKEYARLRDLLVPLEAADIAMLCTALGEKVPLVFRLLP